MYKVYEKDKKRIIVNNKFIYCSSVYMLWKGGASLIEEKYYSSNKPISLKKKDIQSKKKGYTLFRFFELEYAPENYLINNSFKIVET